MIDLTVFFQKYGLKIWKRVCWFGLAALLTINTADLILPKLYKSTIVRITSQDPSIPLNIADVWADQQRVGSTFLTPQADGVGPIQPLVIQEISQGVTYGKNLTVRFYCPYGFLDIRVRTPTQDDTYTINSCDTIGIDIPAPPQNEVIFLSTYLLLFSLYLFVLRKIDQTMPLLYAQHYEKTDQTPNWFYIALMIIPLVFSALIFWPGHFSVDEINQINQISRSSYNNFHPIIHTLLLYPFQISKFPMGYIVMQSLLLVLLGVAVLRIFNSQLSKFGKYVLVFLVYWNPAVLICMTMYWKDIMFALLSVGVGVGLVWAQRLKTQKIGLVAMILGVILLFLMALVRHNGIVSFGVAAICLWSMKKRHLRLMAMVAAALIITWQLGLRMVITDSKPIDFGLYTLVHYLDGYTITHPSMSEKPSSITDTLTTEQQYFFESNGTNWIVLNQKIDHTLVKAYKLQFLVQFIQLSIQHPVGVWQIFLEQAHHALFWKQDGDRPVYWFQTTNASTEYTASLLPTTKLATDIKTWLLRQNLKNISPVFWPISLMVCMQLCALIIAKQKRELILLLLPTLIQYPVILPLLPGADYRYFFFFLISTPILIALVVSRFAYREGEIVLRAER